MKLCHFASSQAICILTTIRSPRIAHTFLQELKDLFVQILLLAQEAGVLKLGTISLDGTKVHADASKRKAVSYKRLLELEIQLRTEVEELFTRAEQSEQPEVSDGLVVHEEIARRQDRLRRLAQAKAVLETRAAARAAVEQAEYETKMTERAEKERKSGRRLGGRPPAPPMPGPHEGDQYNFTDPESRIMKDGATKGFVQAYNAQAAVDGAAQIIVAVAVTQAANDKQQLVPLLTQVATNCGATPAVVSADSGYFSAANVTAPALAGIDLYVAVARQPHGEAPAPVPGPADGTAIATMRAKLQTAVGHAVYAVRKAIVEPVFG